MKWLPALRVGSAALIVISLVLGVLTLRTTYDTRRWINATNAALMTYALADQALQLDLLGARAGLLRDYDPINADLASERACLANLARLSIRPVSRALLLDLTAKAGQREALVERFKSDNALLQNSLTRFTANDRAELGSENDLSARILNLTLDTSPQTVREATAAVRRLESRAADTPTAQIVSHARLLVRILPEIDEILHAIRAIDMERRIGVLKAALAQESHDRSTRILQLQIALALALLLSALTVGALILAQRIGTNALKSQAANARLSAAIATPLIDTGHATFTARVTEAVQRLARHVRATRLQLTLPGAPTQMHFFWPESEEDPEWLGRFIEAADATQSWLDDKVIASRNGDPIAPALDQAMRAAGVTDLVLLRTAEPFNVVIGFVPAELAFAQRRDSMAGVASAIVAIAYAARREVMQQERDRLERILERTRRLETIGAMASGVSHNFNNIIGAIGGFAEMGQERTRNGSPARYSFDEIQRAVARARDLVDDILNFAKQGRAPKVPINLFDILAHAVRLLSASARQDGAFHLAAADKLLAVLGSSRDLEQVFLNICNNAVRARNPRPVEIVAQRRLLADVAHLSHGSLEPGSYIVVSVTDTGPGISEAAQRRLFEPFFTTRAGGTGLGLSTAWEIVQDHFGTIDAQNVPEGGARFSVWLPELTGRAASALAGNGSRILLVTAREHLAADEELLAELGFEPLGFTLSTDPETLRAVACECDAALLAGEDPLAVDELARVISPVLGGRPLLVGLPPGKTADAATPAHLIAYPFQSKQVFDVLVRTGTGSHFDGHAAGPI